VKEKYEYKFVWVKLRGGLFSGKPKDDCRKEIIDNARDGWRFGQAFVAGNGPYGFSRTEIALYGRSVKSSRLEREEIAFSYPRLPEVLAACF